MTAFSSSSSIAFRTMGGTRGSEGLRAICRWDFGDGGAVALSVLERASRRTAVGLGSFSRNMASVLVGEEGGWREPLRELTPTGVAAPEPALALARSVATLSIGTPNIPTAWSVEKARKIVAVKKT